MKDILQLSTTEAIGKPPKATIVCDQTWIDQVPSPDWDVFPDVSLCATPSHEHLQRMQLRDAELLILEVDARQVASLERVAAIKRMHPDLPIIAAVVNTDLAVMKTLLRHGVSNVVQLPFDLSELAAEVYNIGAKLAENHKVSLAPSISMVGSLGRSGSSSILLHLASAMVSASDRPIRACLIDLDVQNGQLASYAGIESSRSILNLLEVDERLDQDMIRNVSAKVSDGVYLISAPPEILPLEQIAVDQLLRIIRLARTEFDVVLLDMPPSWTNWSLSVAAESDHIMLVTEQSVSHLRQSRRCIDLFREVGVERDKISIVVNRATKSRFKSISVQDVADTLDAPVIGSLREDRGELSDAIDQGQLVTAMSRKNPFAADVDALAIAIGELIAGDPA